MKKLTGGSSGVACRQDWWETWVNDYGYDASGLPAMVAECRRQRAKDVLFVETLTRYLLPGSVLEIGAGCGQLSELLVAKGWDVTASDIEPFLVEYMASRGLRAAVLDALNLGATVDRPYENILAGGPSTLVNRDEGAITGTYTSVHAALKPSGRLIVILPNGWFFSPWSSAADHLRLADAAGFDLFYRFRNQVLPSWLYGRLPTPLLRFTEATVARILGVRWVFVFVARPLDEPADADAQTAQPVSTGPSGDLRIGLARLEARRAQVANRV